MLGWARGFGEGKELPYDSQIPFAAAGADLGRAVFGRRCGIGLAVHSKQLAATLQVFGSVSVGEESAVAEPHETFGEDMLQEAADKVIGALVQEPPPAAVAIVFPSQHDGFAFQADQALIAQVDTPAKATER